MACFEWLLSKAEATEAGHGSVVRGLIAFEALYPYRSADLVNEGSGLMRARQVVMKSSSWGVGLPSLAVGLLVVWGTSGPRPSGSDPASPEQSAAVRSAPEIQLEERWRALLGEYRAGIEATDFGRKNRSQAQLQREIASTNRVGLEVAGRLLFVETSQPAREFMMLSIGSQGAPNAAGILARQIERLEASLSAEGQQDPTLPRDSSGVELEARAIFTALGLPRDDSTFEILRRRLEGGKESWPVRALRALSEHPRLGESLPWSGAYLDHEAPGVRAAAAFVVSRSGDASAIPRLAAALERYDDFATRRAILVALQEKRDPGATALLARCLATDPNDKLRTDAVEALAAIGTPEAAEILAQHATTEQNPRVAAKAAAGASQIRDH